METQFGHLLLITMELNGKISHQMSLMKGYSVFGQQTTIKYGQLEQMEQFYFIMGIIGQNKKVKQLCNYVLLMD